MKLWRIFLCLLCYGTLPAHATQPLRTLANKSRANASSNFNPISFSPQKINLSNWPWWWNPVMSTRKCSDKESIGLDNRPPEIQVAIDNFFKERMNTGPQRWLYNGSEAYGLLGLEDDKMLRNLAFENPDKKDIYIIDVGCSRGDWGENALWILWKDEACKKSGKRYHIFSLTGGKECDEIILRREHVTLYQFNQFKIENIDEELSKRGFNLKNNVDLIVSRWTLRHLVDPFGTLKRMYGLLTPAQGKLMSNGFLFMFNGSDAIRSFPEDHPNILSHTNTVLFDDNRYGRDIGHFILHFLLVRNDINDLRIPLAYTNKIGIIGPKEEIDSNMVTIYEKESNFNSSFDLEYIEDTYNHNLYCDKSDQQCKSLYLYLKRQKLFSR